jgi:hypothetical protein
MSEKRNERKWKEWKNNYGIKGVLVWDPPGDGSCLFSAVRECIHPQLICTNDHLRYYSALQILREDKESIDNIILPTYRQEVENKEFHGAWDPMKCEGAEQIAEAIVEPFHSGKGFDFQGDDTILCMLSKILGIDFFMFNSTGKFPELVPVGVVGDDGGKGNKLEKNKYTVFLEYERKNSKHYRALGVEYENGRLVQTMFPSNNLPANFKDYIDRRNETFKK